MATPTQSSATTTIEALPDEMLTEVMLHVPTPAALVHAAAASKRWRRAIASREFLDEYRERHRSPTFLGLYIPREFGGLPSFQMADSIRSASDRDLARAADKAFSLGGLERHPEWRLLDCHNGRLLLARGDDALEVYDPLSRERISVRLPRADPLPDYFSACLLQGHGDDAASFRVVSVQHHRHRRGRMVRAVEYDSRRESWEDEQLKNIEGTEQDELMHAGGLIFCKYTGALLLMLDTGKMEFSVLPLRKDNNPKHCAIGEMEDGVCCLASADPAGLWNDSRLRVWRLEILEWKLEKEMRVKQVLGEHAHYSYYRVRTVTNGIALLCSSKHHLHFAIDLKTLCVKEKFEFKDLAAYPLQMPCPPAFSVATGGDEQSTPSIGAHKNMSVNLADETTNVVDEAQNHAYATKSSEGENPGSREGDNVSLKGITEFQDSMQFKQMDCSNQCDNGVAESNTLVIPNQGGVEHGHFNGRVQESVSIQVIGQPEGSQAPGGAIYSGVQERDTLTHADDKKIKIVNMDPLTLQANLDGRYVECKLNIEDPEIPCNDDVVILGEYPVQCSKSTFGLNSEIENHICSIPLATSRPSNVEYSSELPCPGRYVEWMLNSEDFEIPCNDDVAILGYSNANQMLSCDSHDNRPELRDEAALQNCMPSNALEDLSIQEPVATVPTPAQAEECFDKENNIPSNYFLEVLIPDPDLISCDQDSVLMHPEVTRFHHPEKGDRCAFAVINGLHPKYYIKDPKRRKHTWGPIQVCRKRQRCPQYREDSDVECSRIPHVQDP